MKSRICGIAKRIVMKVSPETGQSLVLALVIVLALTISTAGVITFLTSNEKSFNRDRDATRALAVAEAGLQNAISVLSQYDDTLALAANTRLPSTGSTSYSVDGGTGSYYAVKMQLHDDTHQYDIWTITATGKSANGHVTRTVSEDARASPTITPALPIYNYALYVGGSGTPDPSKLCKVGDLTDNSFVGGSFTATGNLWVGNNLCLGGGAKITLPTDDQYTLYLGGSLQTSGGSAVGEALPGNRLQVANIHGGCYDSGKKAVACSNTPKSSLFAHFANEGAASQTSGKPNIDWTVWTASNWKTPSCTPPPPHPVFEAAGDNAANPVPVSAVSISSVAYNCTFVDSTGSFLGSLQYQPAASSPTGHNLLTISGMVFINGNLDLGSSGNFQYQGNGTIYVNGTVSMQNAVCGYPATYSSTSCTGTWDQNQANMEIVAMNAGNCASTMTTPCTATGWTVNGVGEYDGVAFVRGTVTATGSGSTTEFKGPMITDFIDKINGGGGLYYPSQPPSESPGGVQHGSSWQVSPGTWRQLTN